MDQCSTNPGQLVDLDPLVFCGYFASYNSILTSISKSVFCVSVALTSSIQVSNFAQSVVFQIPQHLKSLFIGYIL